MEEAKIFSFVVIVQAISFTLIGHTVFNWQRTQIFTNHKCENSALASDWLG